MIRVSIITVSDRAARGEYADRSGPALQRACVERGWQVGALAVVPDTVAAIRAQVTALAAASEVVLLTGGTGIAERDVTPEAVRGLATRELPGFGETMRARSFARFPHAILSRGLAAVVARALVICLPGSPQGAVECLGYVAAAVPHAVELLGGENAGHPAA